MKMSARNMLKGEIVSVELGAVMANIKIRLGTQEIITSIITKDSAIEMGLEKGDKVFAVIKSTEVMVAKE